MSLATTRRRAVLLLALCALIAVAAAADQTSDEMLDNLPDAIDIPESIELEGNPVATGESEAADEIQSENEGVDEISAKALSEKSKKRLIKRVLRGECRESVCIGSSTIDLTFIADGKNFQHWRKFAANLVNQLQISRFNVRVNMIVADTTPQMLFDFDSDKARIVSKIQNTAFTPKGTAGVALGEALYLYRQKVVKRGRRFSGKLVVVLTSKDSNFGRSVVNEVRYLARHGVTFLPVMVGYEVSQDFWKSHATGGKYIWVKNFSDLKFVVDAFLHMRIKWKLKITLTSVLKCPQPVRYKTPCKNGFRETLEIGFVKVLNKCNPVTKVVKRKECGCEKGECFASQAMELILVMQASADMGETYFGYEKEFVISMLQKMKIGAKSVRVSVVLFADSVSLGFRLNQYSTHDGVISAIKGLKLLKGKHNAIGEAFLMVREQVLIDSHFKSAKMLIVITDGQSDYGRSVEIEAAILIERSVSILVVGVGAKATDASLHVISKIYIRIESWLKLRFAAKYILRMRISFVARPAVYGALKIRCPKYRRVLVTNCIGGFKTRTVKFYKEAENTCLPQRDVKKVACNKPPECVEGTKVRVGKCDFKKQIRIVTKVHTSRVRDCTRTPCVVRCSRRLVNVMTRCRKVRCVKRKLTIEKRCSKSGVRRIYWGFYSSTGGDCRRVRTKVVRTVSCRGCAKRQISIFHVSIGKKCVGGQRAIYSEFFASIKGKCSYSQVEITKRRCILTKRCKRRARIQVDIACLRKGSLFRGVYWTYRTRLEADGPCVRVRGRLISLIPCGSCTRKQRTFKKIIIGKNCESGFITSYATVFQGEESRTCHKTNVVIRKRTCLSCDKPKLQTTPCISGFKLTYRISYAAVKGKCEDSKALVKKEKCGEPTGCDESSKIVTECSATNKFSFVTTYYYEPKKLCTSVALPAPTKRICNQVADLVFVLDSSTSIQDADFVKESLFVQHVVQNMDVSPTGIRVAVITFANVPKLVFNLDTYSAKSKIIDAMKGLPRDEGVTMTYAAIDLVDSEIFPKRRAGVPFVIVVITDGKSTMGDAIESAGVLKKKGARFVSVGIYNPDPSVTDKINPDELKGISSTGTYWRADDFTKLESIVNGVTRQVCRDMGETKTVTPTKSVCKTTCVKNTKVSDKKPCATVDCRSKTVVRRCKKNRAFRVFVQVTYTFNGKECVPKTRKVINKIPCPPKTCPKAKTVRTYCKPGVANSTKTIIFYVSNVTCTKSIPPRCTQTCLRKTAESSEPCLISKCKRSFVKATKCGGNLRFRSVVTTSYVRVGTVCKETVTTKNFPCPVECPKTHVEYTPCTKGVKFEVKRTITYTVKRSCDAKGGNCTVDCDRRVLREKKSCVPPPDPRRCKHPLPEWTTCEKEAAYKYKIQFYYKYEKSVCVIDRRITIGRLLCPPKPCPKTQIIKNDCVKGAKHRITTTIFYTSQIACSKRNPEVCTQKCNRQATKSAVPCVPIVGCDTARKTEVTKCGAKRRYRSIITTWKTLVGTVCKEQKITKHFPCPVTCPKPEPAKQTNCTKGAKYREIVSSTYTVNKTCVKDICTLSCVRKTLRSQVPCPTKPKDCKKSRKVVTNCSKTNKFSFITTYFYEKKKLCSTIAGGKRLCKTICVEKQKVSSKEACKKPQPCRFVLSYKTSDCEKDFRTVTARYRSLIGGRCVWRSKNVRRIRCSGCSSYQNHYHQISVGKNCTAGQATTMLSFFESRKFKTEWVCHEKSIKVSVIKCQCNKKPVLLIDKECRDGFRTATKVVFTSDRTGACVGNQTTTKIKCPPVKCFDRTVLRKCRKDYAFQYVINVLYKPVNGRCVSYLSKTVKKIPCPPRPCPKSKTITKDCTKGAKNRVTINIFYTGNVTCSKKNPEVCKQTCDRQETQSAVPCIPVIGCDTTKRIKVTKCGARRRYRSVITTWATRVGATCKKQKLTKHFPCPVKCPKLKVIHVPCVGARKFQESRTITYTTEKSCLKSICVLKCVRHSVVARVPCKSPVFCRPSKRVLPCSKVSAYFAQN